MGRRNFFLFCIVIFTVASFLCGAAPSLPMLLVCRVLQGAGGGGMQPMAQAIMADSFEPQKRGQAFALTAWSPSSRPPSAPPSAAGSPIIIPGAGSSSSTFRRHSGLLSGQPPVDDPPWIKADRSRLFHMDYVGLSFLALAHGRLADHARQGRRKCLVRLRLHPPLRLPLCRRHDRSGLVELRHKNPIINLRLFRYKNFAICCFLMALVAACSTPTPSCSRSSCSSCWAGTQPRRTGADCGRRVLLFVCPSPATPPQDCRALSRGGCFILFVITFRYAADVTTLDMTFASASWLARHPDDAHSLLLHLHHHGGLRGHAQGREQPVAA